LHAERKPADIREDVVLESFRVNTIGPMLLAKHFVPFLPRKTTNISPEPGLADHAVYSSMSARVGSTHDNRHGGWYSYRASKAGVTSFMKSLDIYPQAQCGEKAMAIAQHPGTVKTDLSRDYWDHVEGGKLFSPEYAAERLVHVATNLGLDGRGKFWDWQMKEILP
jgi:NAD(P)-dependent dehydrogenase (short-subunit alcohol dehydrogenase family)